MRQKKFLEDAGYKHVTTRINKLTGEKEALFRHKTEPDMIIKYI